MQTHRDPFWSKPSQSRVWRTEICPNMCDKVYSIQNLGWDCSVDGKLCCQVQLAGGTLYH